VNRRLSAAAILAGTAVMLGALGAHALTGKVDPQQIETWKTGAHYHLIHAIALTALAMFDSDDKFRRTRLLWWVGTLIFGTSLYLLVLTGVKKLGAITPLGGASLILGWFLLAWDTNKKSDDPLESA
jgi:uncharacterized membrane protein YgdD (TMEM256/DUF423 family)